MEGFYAHPSAKMHPAYGGGPQRATPEQEARANIDRQLVAAGWTVQDPLSPAKEQAEIVKSVDEQISSLDKTNSESALLLLKSSRLRQSILKRAFEGKLVPQDPEDEPASELLRRIQAERAGEKERSSSPKKDRAKGRRGGSAGLA